MKTVTAKQARIHLGQLMDESQSSPIGISKNGKPYGVLLSAKQFEILGGASALESRMLREHINVRLASSEEKGGEIPHQDLMSELKSRYGR